jgi:ribonuclease P protein component
MCSAGDVSEGQTFAKADRLRKRREFLEVQRAGRKIHVKDLLILVCSRADTSRRVGITVSTKVGVAVQRNRVKRVLREVWRRHRGVLPQGIDVVMIAKRSAADATLAELTLQFHEVGRRLARSDTKWPADPSR